MTIFSAIIAPIVVALLITLIFAMLGSRGPWGALWALFLVLFLALWTTNLYVGRIGPVYWGVAWFPMIFAGILFTILLLALMPDRRGYKRRLKNSKIVEDDPALNSNDFNISSVTIGFLFWLVIALFIVAIIIGSVVIVY